MFRCIARPIKNLTLLAIVISGLLAGPALVGAHSSAVSGEPTANSANARFIVDGYEELFGRTADIDGLDFHLSRLAAGGDESRRAFTYSMLFSVEGSRQEVQRAYASLLKRPVDPVGDAYWTNHLQGNGVLDLRVLLMSSDEYWQNSGGSDRAWLEALYVDNLGRPSDVSGREYWMTLIEAGVARPLIVAGLYLSDEALGQRVDSYYAETLRRSPGANEQADAIRVIRSRGERELRAMLRASDEAFEPYLKGALS